MAWFVAIPIWGLVLARSSVEYMTVSTLTIYLLNVMRQDLLKAAITMNLFDGISSMLALVVAYVAHAYTDHFNVTVFSSTCYVMGLIILYGVHCYTNGTEDGLVNVGIFLIALGKSGGGSTLRSFLEYEVRENGKSMKRRHRRRRGHEREVDDSKIWWHTARIYGYVIAPVMVVALLSAQDNLFEAYYYSFEISALLMGFSSLTFFYGNRFYHYGYETKTTSLSLAHVFKPLRAASSNDLLLWASFVPYGAVLTTAYTLFIAQISNMNFEYTRNFTAVAPPFFFALKSLTSDLVNFLFWSSTRTRLVSVTNAIRIGAGMICSAMSCVAAREVELYRLSTVIEEGLIDDAVTESSANGLWLIPEFLLLGVMEGLVGGGLVTHMNGHVPESMRSFAQPLSEFVVCFGKFCSILFMSLCNFWFGESINHSKMARYFLVLAVLCCVSFCFYLLWWRNFSDGSACESEDNVESNQAEMGNIDGELEEERGIHINNAQQDADIHQEIEG